MAKRVASLFAEIGAKVDGFKQGASEVKSELKGIGSDLDKSREKWSSFGKGALMALAGITAAAIAVKKGFDFAKEGAQLEYVRERFDRLAVSVGTTGEALLGKMKMATKGTLSDFEAMQAASDLLALGLAKDTEEATRLATVQAGLAMDTGELVLALTNQTTRRFDQLGVSVDGFKEKVDELKASGMDANDAFKEAFLQQAEEQLARVGNAADSTAGEYARFEANVKNATNTLKVHVSQGLLPVIEQLNRQFDAEAEMNSLINLGVGALDAKRYAMLKLKEEQGRISKVEQENLDILEQEISAYRDVIAATEGYDRALLNIKTGVKELNTVQKEGQIEFSTAIDTVMQMQRAQDDYRQKLADLKGQLDEGRISQDEYNEAIRQTGEEFRQASKETAFALLIEKLKSGAEGLSDEEFKLALKTGEAWGLIDESVAQTAMNVLANNDEIIESQNEVNEQFASTNQKVEALKRKSGERYTYYFRGVMEGFWPNWSDMPTSGAGSHSGGGAYGGGHQPGFAGGTDFIVPPGFANDSFGMRVSSGERVTVQTPEQQQMGGGPGSTINIYAPVTMMVTKETADILDIK